MSLSPGGPPGPKIRFNASFELPHTLWHPGICNDMFVVSVWDRPWSVVFTPGTEHSICCRVILAQWLLIKMGYPSPQDTHWPASAHNIFLLSFLCKSKAFLKAGSPPPQSLPWSQCWQALEKHPIQPSWKDEESEAQGGRCLAPAPVRWVRAGIRLESHLAKHGVGAERDGDGIDHQQHSQQHLGGWVSEKLLDIHARDELLHVPGILGEDGGPSFRQVSP